MKLLFKGGLKKAVFTGLLGCQKKSLKMCEKPLDFK